MTFIRTFLVAQIVKNLPAMQETWVRSLGQEDLLEKGLATIPVFCLENSMDRRAWRATVHGVAKSQTQLNDKQNHTIIIITPNNNNTQ